MERQKSLTMSAIRLKTYYEVRRAILKNCS